MVEAAKISLSHKIISGTDIYRSAAVDSFWKYLNPSKKSSWNIGFQATLPTRTFSRLLFVSKEEPDINLLGRLSHPIQWGFLLSRQNWPAPYSSSTLNLPKESTPFSFELNSTSRSVCLPKESKPASQKLDQLNYFK